MNRLSKALEHVRRALAPPGGDLTDGQLLARFLAARDEAAFAALLRRHGPMVLGVCRRILRHTQDAEDAFQATFLLLARKAGSVRKPEAVGSWLYGVAYRTALTARGAADRRRARERQVEDMPHPEVFLAEPQDWRPLLDRELSGLPEKYRLALVLCDLEGRPRKEAAKHLGLPEGTLVSRLARARCLLAKRLAKYGLSLPAGTLGAVLSEAACAAVPAPLVSSTTKAAILVAAGQLAALSTPAAVLTKGVLKSMFLVKLKAAVGVVLVAVVLSAGGIAYRATAQAQTSQPPAAPKPVGARSLSELELLRKEVDILKLQVDLMDKKLLALGEELRALKAGGTAAPGLRRPNLPMPPPGAGATDAPASVRPVPPAQDTPRPTPGYVLLEDNPFAGPNADAVREVEAALKALRRAKNIGQRTRATQALEKAVQKLKGRNPPSTGSPGKE